MRALAWVVSVVALATVAPTNFSGTWMTDSTPATASLAPAGTVSARGGSAAAPARPAGPIEERLAQTGERLTIERRSAGSRQKFIYRLDGTESVNVNGRSTRTTTSRWDGEALVTEGTESTSSAGASIVNRFREVRSIDNTGAMLVEATRQFEGSAQMVSLLTLVKKK
jgi:hypothetical protein